MTVEDFYMDIRSRMSETVLEITAAEGSMKSELEVSLPDFKYALECIEDYLCDTYTKTLKTRAENAYVDGRISEDEFNVFKTVLAVIEW